MNVIFYYSSDKMKLSGAGVILFEVIQNRINMILVRETSTRKYTEPGGRKEKKDTIIETARKELYEETGAYIWISDAKLLRDWILHGNKKYKAYIIFIKEIDIDDYFGNLEVIEDDNSFPKSFLETDDITKVSIEKLQRSILRNSREVIDVFGNKITLKGRTVGVLEQLFNDVVFFNELLEDSPILSYKNEKDGELTTLIF